MKASPESGNRSWKIQIDAVSHLTGTSMFLQVAVKALSNCETPFMCAWAAPCRISSANDVSSLHVRGRKSMFQRHCVLNLRCIFMVPCTRLPYAASLIQGCLVCDSVFLAWKSSCQQYRHEQYSRLKFVLLAWLSVLLDNIFVLLSNLAWPSISVCTLCSETKRIRNEYHFILIYSAGSLFEIINSTGVCVIWYAILVATTCCLSLISMLLHLCLSDFDQHVLSVSADPTAAAVLSQEGMLDVLEHVRKNE